MKPGYLFLLTILLALGCAGEPVIHIPASNPSPRVVGSSPEAYRDKPVAWGGVILETTVKQHESHITILAKPLYASGEPKNINKNTGRFIAVFPGFRDPAIYARGRQLSIAGKVTDSIKRKVGEFDYPYPVVAVEKSYLWPVHESYEYNPWYDRWYDPWYGWGYPYHHSHHY